MSPMPDVAEVDSAMPDSRRCQIVAMPDVAMPDSADGSAVLHPTSLGRLSLIERFVIPALLREILYQLPHRTEGAETVRCTHCGTCRLQRFGKTARGFQRYRCQRCRTSFSDCSASPLQGMSFPSLWPTFICAMARVPTLERCAEICGINIKTARAWRKRFIMLARQHAACQYCELRLRAR